MVWEECGGIVVGEGVVLIGDVWFVEECGGTVVGEGVFLICDVLMSSVLLTVPYVVRIAAIPPGPQQN